MDLATLRKAIQMDARNKWKKRSPILTYEAPALKQVAPGELFPGLPYAVPPVVQNFSDMGAVPPLTYNSAPPSIDFGRLNGGPALTYEKRQMRMDRPSLPKEEKQETPQQGKPARDDDDPPERTDMAFRTPDLIGLLLMALAGDQAGEFAKGYLGGKQQKADQDTEDARNKWAARREKEAQQLEQKKIEAWNNYKNSADSTTKGSASDDDLLPQEGASQEAPGNFPQVPPQNPQNLASDPGSQTFNERFKGLPPKSLTSLIETQTQRADAQARLIELESDGADDTPTRRIQRQMAEKAFQEAKWKADKIIRDILSGNPALGIPSLDAEIKKLQRKIDEILKTRGVPGDWWDNQRLAVGFEKEKLDQLRWIKEGLISLGSGATDEAYRLAAPSTASKSKAGTQYQTTSGIRYSF